MLIKYVVMLFISIYLMPSNATITSILNSEMKNLKSADLAEVQLQDVEAYQKNNKLKKNGERILIRKIAPTDLNSTSSFENKTLTLKIATEGSGVTNLTLAKDGLKNYTQTKVIVITERPTKIVNSTKMPESSTSPPIVNNTTMESHPNTTAANKNATAESVSTSPAIQNTTITILKPATTPSSTLNKSSTSTNSTTTTTTTTKATTNTTTTTTTEKPKKPQITYSVEDMPEIANVVPQHSSSILPVETKPALPKLSIDEPEQPIAQPSQEFNGGLYRNHRDYIIPFVLIMFAVPILMGVVIVAYRRFRDFWSTRHYRRMDFLVDGMYND